MAEQFAYTEVNRLQKRAAVFPEYGRVTIPQVCMDLHTSHTGASDGMSDFERGRCIRFLEVCLETWEKNRSEKFTFDDAVRQLIRATLDEVCHG